MLLDNIFQPFIQEKPICVMARAVLQRILDPHHLDQLFARTAQRQYTHELLFRSHNILGKVIAFALGLRRWPLGCLP